MSKPVKTSAATAPVCGLDRRPAQATVSALVLLILLAALIYSGTFRSSFHFDDELSITVNPAIRHLARLAFIWKFWPTRFVTYLSFAVNYHVHQLDVFGYHLVNLAVHLGSGLLVWWLVLLTFATPLMKDARISRHAPLIALFAGLIFVAHPIQTQGVTYIVQRAASLAAFFYLAALGLYVRCRLSEEEGGLKGQGGALRRPRLAYAASLTLTVLAMFTKEITVTLPFMIMLYEACFFRKPGHRLPYKTLAPFLAMILIVPVTMLLTKSVNIGEMRRVGEEVLDISPWHYLLTQFRVLVTYIRLLFLPFNQNLDYDYPIARSLLQPPVLVSLLFLAGLIVAAFKLRRNHRLVSFGIFWFFLTLIPESSLLPINDVIFEHRLYLPMAGFAILLTAGLFDLFSHRGVKPAAVTLSLIIAIFSVLAYQRNKVWKDELTLWNDVIRKSPRNVRAYYNRGLAYQGKNDLTQAFLDYNEALKLNPRYAKAYNNRGLAYQEKGDLDRAFSDYNKAIEIDPEYAKAYNNRGGVYFERGDYDRALLDSSKAIDLDPAYAKAYLNRAVAYFRKGDHVRSWEDVDRVGELGYAIPSEFLDALKKSSGREK